MQQQLNQHLFCLFAVPRFWFSSRFGMAVLGFLGFLSMSALRRCMDVAMVCMLNQTALEELAVQRGSSDRLHMVNKDNITECASVPEFLVVNSSAFSYLEVSSILQQEDASSACKPSKVNLITS